MYGDFSRNHFEHTPSDLSRIALQQGQPIVEADWNEQVQLIYEQIKTLANGRQISLDLTNEVDQRFFVGGLHCHLAGAEKSAAREALRGAGNSNQTIRAWEDAVLTDRAYSTNTRTVWQVLNRNDARSGDREATLRMRKRLPNEDPRAYDRDLETLKEELLTLEGKLLRIEVHLAGDEEISVKTSLDNGSQLVAINKLDALTSSQIGPQFLEFLSNDPSRVAQELVRSTRPPQFTSIHNDVAWSKSSESEPAAVAVRLWDEFVEFTKPANGDGTTWQLGPNRRSNEGQSLAIRILSNLSIEGTCEAKQFWVLRVDGELVDQLQQGIQAQSPYSYAQAFAMVAPADDDPNPGDGVQTPTDRDSSDLLSQAGIAAMQGYMTTPHELMRRVPARYLNTAITFSPLSRWLAPALVSELVGLSFEEFDKRFRITFDVDPSDQPIYEHEAKQLLETANQFAESIRDTARIA